MAKKKSTVTGGKQKMENINTGSGKGKISASVEKVMKELSKEQLIDVMKTMLTSRAIDHKAMNYLRQGKTFFHIAGAGHEAIQAAVGLSLDKDNDWFFPYYRDMTLVLYTGVTPDEIFLQTFAKADDPASGGRQLPSHWGSTKNHLVSQSSPTGTQFLQAVGTALTSKKTGEKRISYVSSGEGTTSQGEFHEAVNWASREKLPVLFVIQNNRYAISVPVDEQSGGKGHSIAAMMAGYENLKRIKVDGTNFFESYEKVREAVDYIKSGKGPVLIEAECVRLLSHSSSDDQRKYRTEEDIKKDSMNDPNEKMKSYLINAGVLTGDEFDEIQSKIVDEINESSDNAMKHPDPIPENSDKYIFDESGFRDTLDYESNKPAGDKIVMVDAINHALYEEMERNDKMYIFGEDVADKKGGVFTATKGLSTKFGDERVFNSPLSEASITGVANGMALAGLKPVVEIQFGDYIWPGFMQLRNETATMRYRSNNAWATPVVTRVAVGGYIHGGLYHSQNIEAIFAHVPGLFVAYPSNAADAKGLLKTACRINDPVIFCEHKGLYRQSFSSSPEPDENYLVPFGKAKVVKEGSDLSVVSYGLSMWDAVFAAKRLEEEGYSVEVIDIRTIIPLDEETIFNSVKKTNKVIVIHEDTFTAGFGAEIAARVADNCFQYLDGPVKRLAAHDCHIPYSPILEPAVLPGREQVYKAIKDLLEF
ncbi:2-oxoisovalerate dehydrogenase subunit beta [bacterium BMS3Abin03]|nr:2-oxoisovalerate dehydrogenase subunit beta [bacterium BMS3Abin03]HDZ58721.1 tungsten formylmethanofuran dehydrogenase [Ignavibacteriales bacterium]